MKDNLIRTTKSQGIAIINLNRPEKRNAMNAALIHELNTVLNECELDNNIRLIMLRGEGEHFCAGADISAMQQMIGSDDDANYDDAQHLADLMYKLYTYSKPTLVLAHGATLGGGLGLLSACDIAVAAENAVFSFSEVKIGIVPSIVSPYVLAAIGERAARYYFLTGERFHAEAAKQIGLIQQIVAPEVLLETGMALAKIILQNGPKALKAAKQLINSVSKEKISELLAQKTAQHLAELRITPEAQEGLKAFLEKRKPNWLVEE